MNTMIQDVEKIIVLKYKGKYFETEKDLEDFYKEEILSDMIHSKVAKDFKPYVCDQALTEKIVDCILKNADAIKELL